MKKFKILFGAALLLLAVIIGCGDLESTIYLDWFKITFESNGGSAIPDIADVPNGTTITAPAPPTRTGYTFGGWYKEAGLTTEWDFDTDAVTDDITLYAKWTPIAITVYTVTFDANGGTVTPSSGTTGADGTLASLPEPIPPTGYYFAGWFTETENGTLVTIITVFSADATIYAQWTLTPITMYTVTFDVDGGSAIPDIPDVPDGTTITEPPPPTKAGNTFGGWYRDAELTTAWDFATNAVTDDITLYAQWKLNTYTVTFNVDDGAPVPADITDVLHGTTITAPTTPPTKANHQFGGWYKEAELTTAWDFATDAVTDDITLYAKWNAIAVTGVTLDGNTTVLTLSIGETAQLTVIVTPNDATNQNVIWSSSDPDVATVVDGLVTAVDEGTAIITVTTVDGGHTVTCEVTVTAFGISLNPSGPYTFPDATIPYTAQTARSVTVTNTGNQPTGALTAALSGADAASFTLSTTSINSIAVGGTRTFTVAPNTGLAEGTYTATVTVTGGNDISAAFNVSFTVNPADNQTPAAADYTIGNLTQTAGSVTAVTITAKSGKSPGAVSNIRYNNSTTIPQTAGTYAVTFDVAAATGWDAATGLSAGTLTVVAADPFTRGLAYEQADDGYGNLIQGVRVIGIGIAQLISGALVIPDNYEAAKEHEPNGNPAWDGWPVVEISDPFEQSHAFAGNMDITSVIIGSEVKYINPNAFNGCLNITNLTIGPNVERLGASAFYNCPKITDIIIPGNVESIHGAVFEVDVGNTSVPHTTITFSPGGDVNIGSRMFRNRRNITDVFIPSRVTSVGEYAFDGCADLVRVEFAEANVSIDDHAFPEGINGAGGEILMNAYLAGGAGTYTRDVGGSDWTKQP